jgi:hypothetical protein
MSNDAASSSTNRFGEAGRFLRHQLSISRICASASVVVRTGRLTGAGAVFLSQFPGRGQRFVQGATFLVGEVITFVVRNQVDNRPFG